MLRRVGWRELAWLLCSSALVGAGLLLVYSAKTQNFQDASAQLARGQLLDLNRVASSGICFPFCKHSPMKPSGNQSRIESSIIWLRAGRLLTSARSLDCIQPPVRASLCCRSPN